MGELLVIGAVAATGAAGAAAPGAGPDAGPASGAAMGDAGVMVALSVALLVGPDGKRTGGAMTVPLVAAELGQREPVGVGTRMGDAGAVLLVGDGALGAGGGGTMKTTGATGADGAALTGALGDMDRVWMGARGDDGPWTV
jgi:hypothetical protein